MRIQNPNGITLNHTIVNQTQDGYGPSLDFLAQKEDIVVLAYQPGMGKTYLALEYMKNHSDTFYFTDRHESLDENISNTQIKNYSHWKGFENYCRSPNMKKLKENYLLPPSIICGLCSRRGGCNYKNQFLSNKMVFAPFEFLYSSKVQNNPPSLIFLDEHKSMTVELKYDKAETITWLNTIQKYSPSLNPNYIQIFQNNNYGAITSAVFQDIQQNQYYQSIKSAYKKNKDDAKLISKLNPYNLERFFKMAQRYNDYNREYYYPLFYFAFDILNNSPDTKLVVLDASFNQKMFHLFLEMYNGEIGFNRPISVKVHYTDAKNKKTTVYSMRKSSQCASWFPKSSIVNPKKKEGKNPYATMENLAPSIVKIIDIYGYDDIGIITYKEIAKNLSSMFAGEYEYFGNLRSKNVFKNKKVLIVIGTYSGSDKHVEKMLLKLFDISNPQIIDEKAENLYYKEVLEQTGINLFPTPKEWEILRVKDRRRFSDKYDEFGFLEGKNPSAPEDIYRYGIYPVEWVTKVGWDDEIYQAYHRSRGLRNDRIIFAFGWFPIDIVHEFSVVEVDKDEAIENQVLEKLKKEKHIEDMLAVAENNGISREELRGLLI
mgnify:CR=1 FL=1